MDEHVRLRMRRAHANHAFYCSCGKIVHGNGGKAGHAYMHAQAGDEHRYVGSSRFYELYPDAKGAPMKADERFEDYQRRIATARSAEND